MFLGVCLVAALATGGYYRLHRGLAFVQCLGPGINLGNSFDVTGAKKYRPEGTVTDYETFWGNPPTTRELFRMIYERGFRTVRIPVSWGEHLDNEGNIDAAWMARVTEVVDWALNEKLYVILDLHHEAWLIPTEEHEPHTTEILESLWRQIAENFKDRGEHLIFEGMNEPRLENSPEEWTSGTPELQQVVNRLNQTFVETVRAVGKENSTRFLMVPAYCSISEREALEALELPEDPRLIVAVHAYLPYHFIHDETGEVRWDVNDPEDTKKIDELMDNLDELFIKKRIPVVISEFGCHKKPTEEERLAWASYYVGSAAERGIPCLWWDNGKNSRVMDRSKLCWTEEALVDILVNGGK